MKNEPFLNRLAAVDLDRPLHASTPDRVNDTHAWRASMKIPRYWAREEREVKAPGSIAAGPFAPGSIADVNPILDRLAADHFVQAG
jgi:hypothetical protein